MGRDPDDISTPSSPTTSYASSARVRLQMQAQRERDTAPELALRRALHRLGYRYRVDRRPVATLRRKADIVFGPDRVAVFVDGCFWHGCPDHGSRTPHANQWYWPAKIQRNRNRDADTNERLVALGWTVVRIWEHEHIDAAVERVADALVTARAKRAARRLTDG